jgi:hypothetical protein
LKKPLTNKDNQGASMNEFNAIDLIGSLFLTWIIGLTPPLVLRYLIIGKPLSKGWAISICALFWFINVVIFIALGSKSKTHAALVLVAMVSYRILHRDNKLDEGAYMERILREGSARAEEEARRKVTYPISAERQNDEEFITLLKSAVNEKRLDTIPNEELLRTCSQAQSIVAFSNEIDIELSKTINTLLGEIKKRGLSQEKRHQKISNHEDFPFKKKSSKWNT